MSEIFHYESYIQENYREKIEAHAFRSLVRHLQERSDVVSNLDLMSTGGFCRNCLAKWLVLAARDLSDQLQDTKNPKTIYNSSSIAALDSFDYNKAANVVYGCSYDEWKSRHLKKASGDQMKRYEESMTIHAKHDDELLKPRETKAFMQTSLLSDVCCQDMEGVSTFSIADKRIDSRVVDVLPSKICTTNDFSSNLPILGSRLNILEPLHVGILTVSDRAAANLYKNGDCSGPAVEQSLKHLFETLNENNLKLLSYKITQRDIVPDDPIKIGSVLSSWCDSDSSQSVVTPCDIIFTTGGTGFSPRDQTPEATADILDIEVKGLMTWVFSECTKKQPLSCLSRGIAGVRKKTLIANLPGNPEGLHDIMVILVPLLLHAVKEIREKNFEP